MFLKSALSAFVTNREFIWEIVKRDLKGLNKGAFLGYFWVFLSPLIQTAFYVLIVSFIFRAQGEGAGRLDYALYVLGGMVPWQVLQKSIAEAPTLISARIDILKQVIYPIETLPLTSILVGSFGSLVAFTIFLVLSCVFGTAKWTFLLLPLPGLLLLLFLTGTSWLLMIVGVILKDIKEVVGILLGLCVYVTPVVASEKIVGHKVWMLMQFNPLSHVVICFRDVYESAFHPLSWAVFAAMSIVVFALGAWALERTKILINEYI